MAQTRSVKDAYSLAKDVRQGLDFCEEWTYAYIFSRSTDPQMDGGPGPVVVLKEDGRVVNWPYYLKITCGEGSKLSDDESIGNYKLVDGKWIEAPDEE